MRKPLFLILVLALWIACSSCNKSDEPTESSTSGWQLAWSDEFENAGLPSPAKWGYDVGGHGWGNNELQYYTSNDLENARVQDGKLIIEARKENHESNHYTSARLVSKTKGDWTYGRLVTRAKLPSGRGTWPAIWMLPTVWSYGNGSWPDNGEIDIMEHVGFDPGMIHASIHTNKYNWPQNTQKTATIRVPDVQTSFHDYVLEWYPDSMSVYVDSTKYFTYKNENTGWQAWPFNKAFHFVLNIAVGGNWGGAQGVDNAIFPQRMEIEYVRVYKWVE